MRRPGQRKAAAPVKISSVTLEAKDPSLFKNPIAVQPEDLKPPAHHVTLAQGDFNWMPEALTALRILNAGECLVLVGSAGTGKSTLLLDWLKGQIVQGKLPPVLQNSVNYYKARSIDPVHSRLVPGSPGFVMGALSHRVTQRLARDLPGTYTYSYRGKTFECSVHHNVMTMHKATEYKPVHDAGDGRGETKMRFRPTRGTTNPIPDIKLVILDEAGQIRLDLGRAIIDACPGAQLILLGDLGQVGAVASLGLLGVALATTNSVELKHVYRSAGPLLAWCDTLRDGNPYILQRGGGVQYWNGNTEVSFLTYATASVRADAANGYCANILTQLILAGKFTFGVDMALCPQVPTPKESHIFEATKFGVAQIWQSVAQALDAHYGRHTYLIRTLGGKKVVAAGDTYIVSTAQGQQEFMVVGLTSNPDFKNLSEYPPALYATRDPDLWTDYMDADRAAALDTKSFDTFFELEPEFDFSLDVELSAKTKEGMSEARSQFTLSMLNLGMISAHVYGVNSDPIVADRVLRSLFRELELAALSLDMETNLGDVAHTTSSISNKVMDILIAFNLSDLLADDAGVDNLLVEISNTSSISTMIPSITTVHKAQGSEAPLVVCMWHHTAMGTTRELLYTANSRARLKVVNICDCDTFGESPHTTRASPINRQAVEGISLAAKRLTYKRKLDALPEGQEATDASHLINFFGAQNGN